MQTKFGSIWLRELLSHILIDVLIYISYMKRKLHKGDLDKKKTYVVGKRNRYFDPNTKQEKKKEKKESPKVAAELKADS